MNVLNTKIHLIGGIGLLLSMFSCEKQQEDPSGFSAEINLEVSSSKASEDGEDGILEIALNKSNDSGAPIKVVYTVEGTATNGEDYTKLTGTATIATSSASAEILLEVTDDTLVEPEETVLVTLISTDTEGVTLGSASSGTISIEDNDTMGSFTAEATVATADDQLEEPDNNGSFRISLDKTNTSGNTIGLNYTLSGTATAGEDYSTLNGTVEIAQGEQSAEVEIEVLEDMEVESVETVILTLNASQAEGISVGTANEATLQIQDNTTIETVAFTFGTATGNSIAIDSWSTISGVDGYIIAISDQETFGDLQNSIYPDYSTTYNGVGTQIVYKGSAVIALDITLLEAEKTYYFKAYPYASDVYDNQQLVASASTNSCVTTSTTENEVCFSISGDERTINSNQYPNHSVGSFPNGPKEPVATSLTRSVDLTPSLNGSAIYVYSEVSAPGPSNKDFYNFGVASNGLGFNPMGLKPFSNPDTGEENWEWQEKVTEPGDTNLDNYGGHITSAGKYHYHGDITGLIDGEDGTRHSKLYGFAADGFPIYYYYGYISANDYQSGVKELLSSYRLKSGTRPGDGTTAPSGAYDGTYIQDYEYVDGLGDLDECNGRTGVTPEYPDGTYYYVITNSFPRVPNCFYGSPNGGFIIK